MMNKQTLLLIVLGTIAWPSLTRGGDPMDNSRTDDAAWAELGSSMAQMHRGMSTLKNTGNSDENFVILMMPHHQAAVDMAKVELLYGKDPQMRRLAQEIVTDQKSEVDVMRLWLEQHGHQTSKP